MSEIIGDHYADSAGGESCRIGKRQLFSTADGEYILASMPLGLLVDHFFQKGAAELREVECVACGATIRYVVDSGVLTL